MILERACLLEALQEFGLVKCIKVYTMLLPNWAILAMLRSINLHALVRTLKRDIMVLLGNKVSYHRGDNRYVNAPVKEEG